MKEPDNKKLSYKGWKDKTFRIEGELIMWKNGLYLYKSLSNLTAGNFGSRVFEAVSIGEYIEDIDKKVCREIRLVRELSLDEICVEELDNGWAYGYCFYVKDRPEIRDKLVGSSLAFWYCLCVEDRPEIRDKIVNSREAYWYCRTIEDRSEIRARIIEGKWAYRYCCDVGGYISRIPLRDRVLNQ